MTDDPIVYPILKHIEPWVCVDLEINPETRKLIQAGVLYKPKGQPVVSKTFNGSSEKDFLKVVKQLITDETTICRNNMIYWNFQWGRSRGNLSLEPVD